MAGPFLRRRGAAYSLRVRVPADLVRRVGASEVGRSLGTRCPRAAREMAMLLRARLAAAWYRIRMLPDDDDTTSRIAEELERTLAISEEVLALGESNAAAAVGVAELREALARARAGGAGNVRGEALAARVDGLLPRIEVLAREVRQRREEGKLAGEPLAALHRMLGNAGVIMRDRPTPTVLTFLRDTFIPERRLAEDSRRHMERYVRLFAKIAGDKPLNTFERKDIVRWVGTLEKVRTGYGKGGKDQAKPIAVILRESAGKPTLSEVTIGKHVAHVKQLFELAVRHHRFATRDDVHAMFSDIRLGEAVPKARVRNMWPLDKLRALFASPIWAGTRSAASDVGKRHQPGEWVHLDANWWLPVLAIHTGARLEELAQLQHVDLKTDSDGIKFLDITDEGDRHVKNANSIRAVPVHPFLLELGFDRLFVLGRKGRIFPQLRQAGRPPKWGQQYSEDFTAYRKAIGIYEPLLDFHAFRHTVVTALRVAGADTGLVGVMVGHVDDPEVKSFKTTAGYTHFSVAPRHRAFCLLDWEAQGVPLSHLRRAVELAGGPRGRVLATDLGVRADAGL